MTEMPFAGVPGGVPWLPSDNNLQAASGDMGGSGNSATLVAGTLYLVKIPVRNPHTATSVWFAVSSAGSGASSGSFVGIYNPSGLLLPGSTSADIGGILTAAATVPANFGTPTFVGALPFYWVAFLSNLATTQPSIRCFMATSTLVNANLTAANYRSCTAGTGLVTLPASITPASNVNASNPLWLGIA